MPDDLTRDEQRLIRKAIRKAAAKAREEGRAEGRREAATLLGYAARLNGSTPHAVAVLKGWDESKHKRDHGRFARTDGGDEPPHEPDDESLDRVMGKRDYFTKRAGSLLASAGEGGVRFKDLLKALNRGGTVYGDLTPNTLAAVLDPLGVEYDGDHVRLIPDDQRGDVYGTTAKAMGQPAGGSGSANTERAPDPAGDDTDADPHTAIAKALLQHAEDSLAAGADPAEGLERLRALVDDPGALASVLTEGGADAETVGKCWLVIHKAMGEEAMRETAMADEMLAEMGAES